MTLLAQPLGYKAMISFLSKRSTGFGELEQLLKELAPDAEGRPADDVREEWNSAVQDAMIGDQAGPILRLGL